MMEERPSIRMHKIGLFCAFVNFLLTGWLSINFFGVVLDLILGGGENWPLVSAIFSCFCAGGMVLGVCFAAYKINFQLQASLVLELREMAVRGKEKKFRIRRFPFFF